MIQANELRIGNWLIFEYDPEFFPNYVQVQSIQESDDLDLYDPIPLTPEILEKAGFRYLDNSWFEKGEISINTKDGSICINQNKGQVFLNLNIKHLHQLQNLYFALTGEELEVKQ